MISFEVNIKDSSLLLLNEFNFYSSGIVGKSMVLASKGLNMRNKEVKFVDNALLDTVPFWNRYVGC